MKFIIIEIMLLLLVCVCVHVLRLSFCRRSKRETTRTIKAKLCSHIAYDRSLACIDLEVRRSMFKITGLQHGSLESQVIYLVRDSQGILPVFSENFCSFAVAL